MPRKLFIIVSLLFFGFNFSKAQVPPIYNPKANAASDIQNAVLKAQKEGKNIFIQIGGNWCPWCHKFHHLITSDPAIKSYVEANFIPLLVNYSKENRNKAVLKSLGFPQRFGFPVFVILNSQGKEVHIQNSAYLEQEKGYNTKKVLTFFQQWSPKALNPSTYN